MFSQGYGSRREMEKILCPGWKAWRTITFPSNQNKTSVKYHFKTVFNLEGGDLNSGIFQTVHKVL